MFKYSVRFCLVLLCLYSCSSDSKEPDKPTVDLRDQAVGTYRGEVRISGYESFSSESARRDTVYDINFTCTKNTDNNLTVDINIRGEIVKGSRITEHSNGFSFSLEKRNVSGISIFGKNLVLEGQNTITIGDDPTKHDGSFRKGKAELELNYSSGPERIDHHDKDYAYFTVTISGRK